MRERSAATMAQLRAANPARSTWLSANAGSGKTRVLTDRVARLLLGGTEPNKILCLTYTKAAAAEMQNRLLDRLGKWAMLEDAALREELWELGEEEDLAAPKLAAARRLFAKAIETPGGLKIQTIHSFCAAVLRRFPLEAGVSHGFSEMDDRAGAMLRAEILNEIALSSDCAALDGVARYLGDDQAKTFLQSILSNRAHFEKPLSRTEALAAFELPEGYTAAELLAETLTEKDLKCLHELAVFMAGGNDTDVKMSILFKSLKVADAASLRALESVLLFKTGNTPGAPKLGKVPSKPLQKGPAGAFVAEIDDLAERLAEARLKRFALASAEEALQLHSFARAFLPRYEARKAERGWLDFDDQINRAARLLSVSSVAQWVLFRLDGGIDHILVDEAQDTSPAQWRVIEALASEFTSGEGARDLGRTLFVVGDKKQSIYSFQGADLAAFDRMQQVFSERYQSLGDPMQELELAHSFRSSPAVLRLVDLTFDERVQHGIGGEAKHVAFFDDLPGRVDLWPELPEVQKLDDPLDWENPRDLLGETDSRVVLARAIAQQIREMIDSGVQIPARTGARPVHEGDFLILVQRRSDLFHALIRACKSEGLAIAGADRLKLSGEIAVKDLRALIVFLVTPEDDLALASLLRSPVFGWDEARLYALAAPRAGYLWEALRAAPSAAAERAVLSDMLDHADFLRPYELLERFLVLHRGRERLLARLGVEAEDGIDELLAQALSFEQLEVPSLTGFLSWLDAADVEVKRELEGAGRAIRVMTVHGAKGLEAPIVILPETGKRKAPPSSPLIEVNGLITRAGTEAAVAVEQARAARRALNEDERLRLLYVAATRAEHWLILCFCNEKGEGVESWYALVEAAMAKAGATLGASSCPIGPILRLQHGAWPDPAAPRESAIFELPPVPEWVGQPAKAVEQPLQPLSPSGLGGAKAIAGGAGLESAAAMARGSLIHGLIEAFFTHPEEQWGTLVDRILSQSEPAVAQLALAEARAAVLDPALQAYRRGQFEIGFSVSPACFGGRELQGVLDCLLVEPAKIRVLDFKTNAIVPRDCAQVPDGIVRQMAAYGVAMKEIYPDREISLEIYWTASGALMTLPAAQLEAALANTTGYSLCP